MTKYAPNLTFSACNLQLL